MPGSVEPAEAAGPDRLGEVSCGSVRLVLPAGLDVSRCAGRGALPPGPCYWRRHSLPASVAVVRQCGCGRYPRRHTGYGIPRRSRPMGQGWTEERPPMGSGIPPISSVAAWLIRVGGLSVVSPTGEPREPCSRHGVVKGGGACFRINTWRVVRGRALIKAVLRGRQ